MHNRSKQTNKKCETKTKLVSISQGTSGKDYFKWTVPQHLAKAALCHHNDNSDWGPINSNNIITILEVNIRLKMNLLTLRKEKYNLSW